MSTSAETVGVDDGELGFLVPNLGVESLSLHADVQFEGTRPNPGRPFLDTQRMLHEVEAEIMKLERVADALRGSTSERGAPRGKRKGMSAAARKKISLAQKARWAKTDAKSSVSN